MKTKILLILIFLITQQNLKGEEELYRAKAWCMGSPLFGLGADGLAGVPPYLSLRIIPLGIGAPPPVGLGIGTSLLEFSWFFTERDTTVGLGVFLPIYVYWVPYMKFSSPNEGNTWSIDTVSHRSVQVPEHTIYLFGKFGILGGHAYIEDFMDLEFGVGSSWSGLWIGNVGFELGLRKIKYYDIAYDEWFEMSNFYFGAKLSFLSNFWGIGVERIPPPSFEISTSFSDADRNNILSENEEGNLEIKIENKGKGEAKDVKIALSIIEEEFKHKIEYENFYSLGNFEPNTRKNINVPIKAKGELPRGKFTIKIDCHYLTSWNEKSLKSYETIINTAPSHGMFRVAFENISPSGLPSWIIPTPLEYADYQVKYSQNTVTILNLNTGERITRNVSSSTDAQNYVKNYFLSWDKASPIITLSFSGGMVSAERIKMFARLSDDRKIEKLEVYLNNNLYKEESFAEQTEAEREFLFPLKMGDNTIRFVLTDWCGKMDEETISLTRIRGEGGIQTTGSLPPPAPPPNLIVSASPIDNDNTIIGGKEEGIKVTVTNRGQGIARWVRVLLEGDEFLTRMWGKERNLEDIRPNETKTATFSILMPTELERREARINIVVKEGRGYSPAQIPSFTFTLIPAERYLIREELVEDVDHNIPEGRTRRNNGYALIIGISKYQKVREEAKYAKNDAETFSRYASQILGIPPSNIETLYNENATGGVIKAKLTDWLKRKSGFKVIYFAGHGLPDLENPTQGDVYLLPYDGDLRLRGTLISRKEIEMLGAQENDTILIFLDACFSGGEGRTPQLASRPLIVSKIKSEASIIFSAAEGTQIAKEFEKARHGYFTYYLLLGLKGKAADENGYITIGRLYEFVKQKVEEATNNLQSPVLKLPPQSSEQEIKRIRIAKLR